MTNNPIPTGVPVTPEPKRKAFRSYGAHTEEELLGVKTGRFTSEKPSVEEVDKKVPVTPAPRKLIDVPYTKTEIEVAKCYLDESTDWSDPKVIARLKDKILKNSKLNP